MHKKEAHTLAPSVENESARSYPRNARFHARNGIFANGLRSRSFWRQHEILNETGERWREIALGSGDGWLMSLPRTAAHSPDDGLTSRPFWKRSLDAARIDHIVNRIDTFDKLHALDAVSNKFAQQASDIGRYLDKSAKAIKGTTIKGVRDLSRILAAQTALSLQMQFAATVLALAHRNLKEINKRKAVARKELRKLTSERTARSKALPDRAVVTDNIIKPSQAPRLALDRSQPFARIVPVTHGAAFQQSGQYFDREEFAIPTPDFH